MAKNAAVSLSVIKRLPRYYRFLGDLLQNGIHRISSKELAEIMNLTASQIRQDLNCFGGFGQQGYGYNVAALHSEIANILGLDSGFKTILLGAGNLGRAITTHMNFDEQGFHLVGVFDSSAQVVGTTVRDFVVQHTDALATFCGEYQPVAAILCVPKESASELVPKLIEYGVKAFWNFSHFDINAAQYPNVAVENVHLGDSMMTLSYQVKELISPTPKNQ